LYWFTIHAPTIIPKSYLSITTPKKNFSPFNYVQNLKFASFLDR
jgi:hypothetical protein